MSDLLALSHVFAGYGRVPVLHDVTLCVRPGEMVALVGSNGAGKSTLLKTVSGLIAPTKGDIHYDGASVAGMRAERMVSQGVALVPEGRMLFATLSVTENLLLGGYRSRRDRGVLNTRLARVHELFPVLRDRASQSAATLSGGEQQMLAVGRALMSAPRLLLLDEPSLGLAPRVISQILETLSYLKRDGVTILLVEQDARLALRNSDRGYVMSQGRIVLEGAGVELAEDDSIKNIYLGADTQAHETTVPEKGRAQ